nr:X-ray repair cross-complementing protein 5 [Polyrhizophydium stewartii]
MANKTATVFVIDVRSCMSEPADEHGVTPHDKAHRILALKLQELIIAARKGDKVGLVLLGTPESDNPLAKEDQYQNISVYEYNPDDILRPATIDLLRFVMGGTVRGGDQGDVLDALIVAFHLIQQHCKQLKYSKRILACVSADGPIASEGWEEVAATAYGNMLDLQIVAGFLDTLAAAIPPPTEDSGDNQVIDPDEAFDYLNRIKTKQIHGTTVFRGPLTYGGSEGGDGGLMIPVWAYLKTSEVKIPSAKKYSRLVESMTPNERQRALAMVGNNFGKVDITRSFKHARPDDDAAGVVFPATAAAAAAGADGDDANADPLQSGANRIDPMSLTKAYKYGKSIVPISVDAEEQNKIKSEKSMVILGFVKLTAIPRHYFMSGAVAVVPETGNPVSARLFRAFIEGLAEQKCAAIVRYCRAERATPKLGAIMHSRKGYGVFLQASGGIPYADDLRQFKFPLFEHLLKDDDANGGRTTQGTGQSGADARARKLQARNVSAQEALDNVDELIDAMDISNANPDFAFNPKTVFNPMYQRVYQCITHRAVNPDTTDLPPPDPRVLSSCSPNPEILARAAPVVEKLQRAFTITKVERDTGRTDTRVWRGLAETAAAEAAEAAAADAEPPGSPSLLTGPQPATAAQLTERMVDAVSTFDPVGDFTSMLARRDVDVADAAITQMCAVIEQLVSESMGTSFYAKALDAIVCLRAACVERSTPAPFNVFVHRLKGELLKPFGSLHRDHRGFWDLVAGRGVTLVSSAESRASGVTPEEAAEASQLDMMD